MEALLLNYGVEWLNLLLRWLHLITGIAWIGASFYFVWLDNSIKPPKPGSDLEKAGVSGELWAVHGGGFYNPQKYLVAPKQLPPELHWFKWEAYWTWLSGFALLWVVYYFNPSAMMIDRSVMDLAPWQAVAIGLGSLVVGWTVYDLLCRSPLGQREGLLAIVIFVLLVASSWGLGQMLGGRAAYIHVGAMIGTIMVANVLMVIIPGQRKMVDAMKAGGMPDPVYGKRAKQRSVHNNYFTLPVLFIMISNHYAMTYNHPHNWAVLALIMAAGVLIRHFFNLKHKGIYAWQYPAAGVALLIATAVWIAPSPVQRAAPVAGADAPAAAVDTARIREVVMQRCAVCHSAQPTQPGFASAPAGVMLHTEDLMRQHAERIYRTTVQTRSMPIGNLTNMTEEERALIAQWFQAGAR
ncbi:MAG TPA: urate hydroxylase PuuD [Noviherbaspirillum sp.]|nr:urate hydroxylase PuuD [Noviherbaspirillum sp.]